MLVEGQALRLTGNSAQGMNVDGVLLHFID